jgi:hypothetical protein
MTVPTQATGECYEYVADPEATVERPVYIHRLAAVAWGELDGLDDHRHVHHEDSCPWHNAEGNLSAVEPERHAVFSTERRTNGYENTA